MNTLRCLATLALGLVLGLAASRAGDRSAWISLRVVAAADAAERTPLYYRDPDGLPRWSATPKQDARGRDYLPVYEDAAAVAAAQPKPPQPPSRRLLYYRNPMGLADTSPTPKKDSMGMDYIPVYEGEDADDDTVRLSPGRIQRTGVRSEPARRREIHATIRAPGTIQLDERRVSVIALRAESFVQKIADVTTGSRVTAGQPLMEVYSAAVASAAAEYLATINSRTTGGSEFFGRGSRQRLVNLDVPEQVIAAMEKNHVAPVTVQWSAPRDGVVLERNAVEGMRANPGDVLFRIADISMVWALVDVAERDLGRIAVGEKVTIRARGLPGRTFAGTVAVVYPQVNRETRTARLRIELANPNLVLLPDMFVDADIDTGDPAPVLAVPESAVLDTGSRQVVLVDRGEGRFAPRPVRLGRRGGGLVEVTEGLSDGDNVVVAANFLIDAESNLKAALRGFADGSGAAASPGEPR